MTAVLRIAVKNDTAAGLRDVRRDVEAGLQSVARLDDALPTSSVSALRDEIRSLASDTQRGFATSGRAAADYGKSLPSAEISQTRDEVRQLAERVAQADEEMRASAASSATAANRLTTLITGYISLKIAIFGVSTAFSLMTLPARLAFTAIELGAKTSLFAIRQLADGTQALAKLVPESQRAAVAIAGLVGPSQIARTAISRAFNIGPQLLGAQIALTAFEAVMARTGKRVVGEMEDFSRATEAQVEAFNRLADEANAAGITIDEAMQNAGKTWDDFGVRIVPQVETNLDRIHQATGRLGSALAKPFHEGIAAGKTLISEWWAIPGIVGDVWRAIDAKATAGADNLVDNLTVLQTGYEQVVLAARAHAAVGTNPERIAAYKAEVELLREQAEVTARLTKLNADNRDDFAIVRRLTAEREAQAKSRGEAERLASIKTVAGIDAEIQKIRERIGQAAQEGKLSAGKDKEGRPVLTNTGRELTEQLAQLDRQRTVVAEQETRKREQLEKDYADRQKAINDELQREHEDHYARRLKLAQDYYASAEKLQASERSLGRELQSDIRQSAQQTRLDRLQAANASQAELQQAAIRARAEQLQATGASEAQIGAVRAQALQAKLAAEKQAAESEANLRKQTLQAEIAAEQEAIDAELDARKKSAKTAEELQRAEAEHAEKALKQTYDSARKWLKLETELQREEMQRQVQARQAKAQMEESVERDKLRRLSQLREMATNAINKGGAQERLQEMRQQLSQRDVARQIGNRRADAAEQDWLKNGSQKFIEDRVAKGAERADAERQAAVRQKQIRNQAFAGGFGDTMRGRTNEQETLNAQNELIKANVQAATATGQLAPIVAQGLQMAAQQAIQASQEALVSRQIAEAAIAALQANGQKHRAAQGGLRR